MGFLDPIFLYILFTLPSLISLYFTHPGSYIIPESIVLICLIICMVRHWSSFSYFNEVFLKENRRTFDSARFMYLIYVALYLISSILLARYGLTGDDRLNQSPLRSSINVLLRSSQLFMLYFFIIANSFKAKTTRHPLILLNILIPVIIPSSKGSILSSIMFFCQKYIVTGNIFKSLRGLRLPYILIPLCLIPLLLVPLSLKFLIGYTDFSDIYNLLLTRVLSELDIYFFIDLLDASSFSDILRQSQSPIQMMFSKTSSLYNFASVASSYINSLPPGPTGPNPRLFAYVYLRFHDSYLLVSILSGSIISFLFYRLRCLLLAKTKVLSSSHGLEQMKLLGLYYLASLLLVHVMVDISFIKYDLLSLLLFLLVIRIKPPILTKLTLKS